MGAAARRLRRPSRTGGAGGNRLRGRARDASVVDGARSHGRRRPDRAIRHPPPARRDRPAVLELFSAFVDPHLGADRAGESVGGGDGDRGAPGLTRSRLDRPGHGRLGRLRRHRDRLGHHPRSAHARSATRHSGSRRGTALHAAAGNAPGNLCRPRHPPRRRAHPDVSTPSHAALAGGATCGPRAPLSAPAGIRGERLPRLSHGDGTRQEDDNRMQHHLASPARPDPRVPRRLPGRHVTRAGRRR